MTSQQFINTKVSIIGAARSGMAIAQLMKSKGAQVFVSEKNLNDKISAQIPMFKEIDVAYEFGQHTDRVFDAELIIISPGVPSDAPIVVDAVKRGIKVVSELEAASWFCNAPIVAITGSNGKTTTTTLAGRIFSDSGANCIVAGNIGTAFSTALKDIQDNSVAIVEVSSFQLDHIESFHPYVSVILNVTPNHLDRYGNSFDAYRQSKARIFMNQTSNDYLVYCYDDTVTREMVHQSASSKVKLLPFGLEKNFSEGAFIENGKLVTNINGQVSEVIATADISIKGIHNLYDAMAATLSAQIMGIKVPSIRATLKNFKGVEHRQEFVREINGVRFINDSKATTVSSVRYALMAFNEPVVLMLGGREKGKNDYSELYPEVDRHVKAILALGDSSDSIEKAFLNRKEVIRTTSMIDAVQKAQSYATRGDIVLLSPAGTAFDWFENYEHRGRVFKECVRGLEEK